VHFKNRDLELISEQEPTTTAWACIQHKELTLDYFIDDSE
jgi:hypothetical protein